MFILLSTGPIYRGEQTTLAPFLPRADQGKQWGLAESLLVSNTDFVLYMCIFFN